LSTESRQKRIEVAVGIVYDDVGRVLVGQRTVEDLYFQKWEFPGGKLEANECAAIALKREFKEEVGIIIATSSPLMKLDHDYPDRHVRLHVQIIDEYTGSVRALEGQALQWVSVDELSELDFLQGNQRIIETLVARSKQ